jgi:penicillin-binding protein 2
VALLKDPEIRARIEQPMPMPDLPQTAPDQRAEGAEPPPPTDAAGNPV